jgi:hypothetical protein
MSVVTEHLEQRGSVFEVLPHRQAYTSVEEARPLGMQVDEVLKTDYELGALPPLGALLDARLYVDPEVLGHDTVTFAAGSQTEVVMVPSARRPAAGGRHSSFIRLLARAE